MKLHKSIYTVILVLFLIVQTFIHSVELSIVLSGCFSFILLAIEPLKISKSFSNTISYLLVILSLGIFSSIFYEYESFDRIRDFIHFLKPILICFLGYLLVVRINNPTYVLKLIVFLGVFLAVKHLITLVFADLPSEFRIDRIRAKAGSGNFIELVALLVLFTFHKRTKLLGHQSRWLFILIISISFIFYFSRIMVLGLFIFLFSIYEFTKLSGKAFEYFAIISCAFGLFFGYLFTLDLKQEEEGLRKFFYKIKNAPREVFASPDKYNPRDHKQIFNHWRGYEAKLVLDQMKGNPISYINGKGFGALVDLGFKAPVGGTDGLRFIPHLHNGYVYLLYKVGIIGLGFYLIFLYNLYKQTYFQSDSLKEKRIRRIVSGFGLYFFASSLVITGLYNLSETSIFCLGMFIALAEIEKQHHKKEANG